MQIKDMKTVNQNMHFSFLQSAFSEFLKKDSFVDKIKRSIGEDIDYSIGPDELFNETGMRASDPVTSIFYWLSSGEEFELEWLFDENGNIYSDSGEFIKPEDVLEPVWKLIKIAFGSTIKRPWRHKSCFPTRRYAPRNRAQGDGDASSSQTYAQQPNGAAMVQRRVGQRFS